MYRSVESLRCWFYVGRPCIFYYSAFIVLNCMLFGNRKDWIYIICMGLGSVLIGTYFVKAGRLPERVFDVLCLNVVVAVFWGKQF